jgi:hypothetical protein
MCQAPWINPLGVIFTPGVPVETTFPMVAASVNGRRQICRDWTMAIILCVIFRLRNLPNWPWPTACEAAKIARIKGKTREVGEVELKIETKTGIDHL